MTQSLEGEGKDGGGLMGFLLHPLSKRQLIFKIEFFMLNIRSIETMEGSDGKSRVEERNLLGWSD